MHHILKLSLRKNTAEYRRILRTEICSLVIFDELPMESRYLEQTNN